MKKAILVFSSMLLLAAMSFKAPASLETLTLRTGTYGVCGCDGLAPTAVQIELSIHDDHSFHYLDQTNPDKKMDVTGTWTRNGNAIQLKSAEEGLAIPDKWSMDEQCLKSRKGLRFTRLCHLESCN